MSSMDKPFNHPSPKFSNYEVINLRYHIIAPEVIQKFEVSCLFYRLVLWLDRSKLCSGKIVASLAFH